MFACMMESHPSQTFVHAVLAKQTLTFSAGHAHSDCQGEKHLKEPRGVHVRGTLFYLSNRQQINRQTMVSKQIPKIAAAVS